ncbi:MAG: hypothetical protein LR011_05915 [Verrucomicrobia bacterium]|nr:hypothetical protein [Verrucomicrobiota bacterium]
MGEPKSMLGEFVEVGRSDFAAITPDIAVAHVIGHHENNVRPLASPMDGTGMEHPHGQENDWKPSGLQQW